MARDKKGSGSEGVSPIAGNDPSRIRGDSGYPTAPERSVGTNASGLTKAATEPFSRPGHGRTHVAGLSENAQNRMNRLPLPRQKGEEKTWIFRLMGRRILSERDPDGSWPFWTPISPI
ncbi:hypothetical protein [Leptospirillum sp. Group II 'CF-1']|uniref:hypothetical protein n=1 Tax=Leptospirillum sp. Group II 'CF-1' TaxID=1660083 RepID=UPI0002E23875|nr:hypothetical protein [Leptospirillum sp. Group II 'CF-1']